MEVVGHPAVMSASTAMRVGESARREPRRPAGIDPDMPFEPISIGFSPIRDRANAALLALNDRLGFWERFKLDRLRRRHPGPLDQGVAGVQLALQPGSTRIAVIGDFGDEDSATARRIAAQVKARQPSAVATVGDNVYPIGSERDWQRGFDPPELYGDLVKQVPFYPSLGNHDYYAGDLRPYFRRFPHLDGKPYYAWRSGDVQFVVLDTEQRLDGASAQHAWLGAQLAASDAPYRVVYLHRPPWSSAGVEPVPAWRGDLSTLLVRHGVQLVIAGHEHSYERTQPIDGVTFLVAGGGGGAIYPFRAPQPGWSAMRSTRSHFLELEQQDGRLVARAIDDAGVVFDTVAVAPR
jgi:hypothetical protein